MHKIFKYKLPKAFGVLGVKVPKGRIIHIDVQNSELYMWVEYEDSRDAEVRRVLCVPTGEPFNKSSFVHFKTILVEDLVLHFYIDHN